MAISALVVVEPVADALVAKIKERAVKLKTGDGTKGADMGPLVTQVHRDKVASYVDAGEKEGATIVVDGRTVNPGGNGFWLGPTLIDQVPTTSKVYQEEIFGPVLSVFAFTDLDEAIREANATPFGLQAGVWTSDLRKAHKMARALRVGTVHVNQYDEDDITVPFGGYKQSGNGREWGPFAFEDFLEIKAIMGG